MNISALSIRYPVPAVMLFLLLTLFGFLGFERLGIQDFPDTDLPAVVISASLEGAAPEQLETEVARKLEDQLTSLRLLKHVTTQITEGSVLINVIFDIDKDGNEALNEVRNAVDSAAAELPANLDTPSVTRLTTNTTALLTYVVDAPRMDEEALSWFVDNELSKQLLTVRGVAKISRVGGVDREVQVDLDPALMAGLGLSVTDIADRLRAMQKDNSGGQGDLGSGQQALRVLGGIDDPAALDAIRIPVSDGRMLAVQQLATVRDTHAERNTLAYRDGKPVIGFQVIRSLGFSDVGVTRDLRQAVNEFAIQHPDVRIEEASNAVEPVMENYRGSMALLYA
ncbi:AcrB/AcrD/AcrF family protein, partial [Pseudomonas syringae]|uniref:efflux RND transporter permease subunit n=1 Tax=Pseudomonas syringae TaxID=317 RepID=UPI001F33631E